MKTWQASIVLAVLTAIAIALVMRPMPVADRLAIIQIGDKLPPLAEELSDEAPEILWLMIEYADDPLLLLKAQSALLRYPELSREVLPLYGFEPEFKQVLAEYGEQVVLPIHYFLTNEVRSVQAMHYATSKYREAKGVARRAMGLIEGETEGSVELENETDQPESGAGGLSDIQRGWYAVNFIDAEGYDFLGQFRADATGQPQWMQVERYLEAHTGFFVGGIRDLGAAWQMDMERTWWDYGEAALDFIVVGTGLKLARGAMATMAGAKGSTRSLRVPLRARRAVLSARMVLGKVTRVGLVVLMVANPVLINDVFVSLAAMLGLPAWVVQVLGWSLLLSPVFYVASRLYRYFARPLVALLAITAALLSRGLAEGRGEEETVRLKRGAMT